MDNPPNGAPAPSPAEGAQPAAPVTPEAIDNAVQQNASPPQGTPPQEPAQPAATPPAPAADPAAHWSQALPQPLHELAQSFDTLEEAKAALERGKNYTPATKVEDITITFAEDVQVNQAEQDSFKAFCVEKGITPTQAQDLATWQMEAQRSAIAGHKAQSEKALKEEWGANYEANTTLAMTALTNLDRKMGGTLAPIMRASHMHNDATFIKALYHIGANLQEDTLGAGQAPAAQPTETAEQAFKTMFK